MAGLVGDLRLHTITNVGMEKRTVGSRGDSESCPPLPLLPPCPAPSSQGGPPAAMFPAVVVKAPPRPPTCTRVCAPHSSQGWLMKDSLVEGFPLRDRPFYRSFTETQMFAVFRCGRCQGAGVRSESAQDAEGQRGKEQHA